MPNIHSDDYGYKIYSDKKIIQLIKNKRIKSVSVLSTMVGQSSLKALKKQAGNNNHLHIGLHLNLIEGKSNSGKDFVPSLLSGKGNFYFLPVFLIRLFLKTINKDHLKREIEQQIDKLQKSGLTVNFIDSHQHVHALSPVAEILDEIVKEKKIKNIRTYNNIRTYTFIAKCKFLLLKLASVTSYYLEYGKLGLPSSWRGGHNIQYSIMSWEGGRLDFSKITNKSLILVTHPFLPFDTNKSYISFLI